MLRLVHAPVENPALHLPVVELRTDRLHLAKRMWRGTADDGATFGFDLPKPLQPGMTFFQTEEARYVVTQEPERVLEVALDLTPCAAAGVGWAVGNLHLELMGQPDRLLTPDDKGARQLFDRLGIAYRPVSEVFRPGRFTRGPAVDTASVHELGSSHRHGS